MNCLGKQGIKNDVIWNGRHGHEGLMQYADTADT